MKKYETILGLIIAFFIFSSCSKDYRENGSPEYIAKINNWHKERIENLKKENGWLNLVGLYWLKKGDNKFGSDKSNDIIFPEGKAPKFIGSLILEDSTVTAKINPDAEVKSGGVKIISLKLKDDLHGETVLESGSLRWFIIKRGDKYGVRLRDLNSDLLKNFTGIDTYPVNSNWRFEASLEPYPAPKKVLIQNVLGQIDSVLVPAALKFEKEGIVYRIDPLDAGRQYFILFADETSGNETYGSGRFLYADKTDSTGKIIIDFNKAYNPPCAFTKYATCPLPPQQNYLKMNITAGEKMFHGAGH